MLHEQGQSLWLDNITREMLDSGQLPRYIDDYSVTGLTSNPSIFDKAIASGDYDDAIRDKAAAGLGRGRCSSSSRSRTCAARPTCSCRSTSAPTASTAGSRSRSRRCSRTTPTSTIAAAKAPARAGRAAQPVHQDPGHRRRACPAIEESHRRRRADQRDPAVLGRAVPGGRRGVPARRRAAHRAGLDPAVGSVASVFMSRWDEAVADERARRTCRIELGLAVGLDVYRPTGSSWTPSAGSGSRTRARGMQRLLWASTEHQGPERARHPLRARARRAVHRQHDARRDARGVLRPRRGRRADAADGGDCDAVLAAVRQAPASTSRRSPRSSRPTAPSRSSTRGRT